MDLTEMKNKFLTLVGCKNTDNLTDVLRKIVMQDSTEIFNGYIELVNGDLKTDYLQQIFQYYIADRKEKCQDFTPKTIGKLLSALTGQKNKIYDLCAGSGALTIQKWADSPNAEYICEELDESAIPYLIFNLRVRNIHGWVINRDALSLNTKAIYKLESGSKYSTIEESEQVPEIKADCIISNPPYNIPWDAPMPLLADERFRNCDIPPKSNANYAFILTALYRMVDSGKCAFILPNGILTSEPEKGIRKYLIDSGMVESIITLPDHMFEATDIPICVMLFSKGNKAVKMFDCHKQGKIEIRDQNGQYGGASHEKRTYHKEINILSDELIRELSGIYSGDKEGLCKAVFIDEIASNDYVFTPSRYIEYPKSENKHRDYKDIICDINRIARERSILKLTINETLAKKLGISSIVETENKEPNINDTFKLFGMEYEQRKFVQLSKNKNEFKIENQDKELFSSLLSILVPMWKQHVVYCNNEENRLLAELRDAMLPDLMSGKIKVE